MIKSVLTKAIAFVLALSFVLPTSIAFFPAKPVEAQAGRASACIAGMLVAMGVSVPAWVNEIIGVRDASGDTGQDLSNNAATYSVSFNDCILYPLAKQMVIALIRNIGSSVVNWVNSGFEGSPTFVTDFEGTLLDAADQAVGNFIEGTELGFLCNDFGFQIRIALALKYSKPFREKARCTLSEIGDNIATNGGRGWDNWLSITTEPQNNAYGAYVIAESELAQRLARAADIKEKRVAIGQGFLDHETCAADGWETPEQVSQRVMGTYVVTPDGGKQTGVGQYKAQVTRLNAENFTNASGVQATTETFTSNSTKPQCLKKTISTPGTVIAGKLNSTFAQGDIQAAVAQEIDDVIAATMNQLAQKVITGAYGLLGMSKKRGTTQSYYNRYQSQLYGVTSGSAAGATSPTEDYQIRDFDAVNDLLDREPLVQDIYKTTDVATAKAVAEQQAQYGAINQAYGSETSNEQNLSLLKSASQSSFGGGSAANAVNGIKDANVSQYNQPATTAEEQNPWWEVDLGESREIKEVRIWRPMSKPASQALGSIRVVASDGNNANAWISNQVLAGESTPNPIVVPVGQSRRYVRIEKVGVLDQRCRVAYQFGNDISYESCYHPLELVEVEVIGAISINQSVTQAGANTPQQGSSQPVSYDDGRSATSTLSLTTASPATAIASGSSQGYEIRLSAEKPISTGQELVIKTSLKRNGVQIPYLSIFASFDFLYGREGEQIATYSISPANDSGAFQLSGVTQSNPGKYFMLRQRASGIKTSASAGTYTIETSIVDKYGTTLKTETANFVVQ